MSDIVHNEKVKLRAAALDRASTACFAGSILAPWTGWQLIVSTIPEGMRTVTLALLICLWAVAGLTLHNLADRTLEGLR